MIATTLLLTVTAQASFLQETCTSANQSVILNSGHVDSELSVKYYRHHKDQERLQLDRFETNVEYSNEETITEKSYNSCDNNPELKRGYATWDSYKVKDIVITNNDGSEFPHGLLGLSQDAKSISAKVFCHKAVSSQVMCVRK